MDRAGSADSHKPGPIYKRRKEGFERKGIFANPNDRRALLKSAQVRFFIPASESMGLANPGATFE